MIGRENRLRGLIVLALCMIFWTGCSLSGNEKDAIQVMFDGKPQIYSQNVFYMGQSIGAVTEQASSGGSVFRVSVRLEPEFEKTFGRHWVFYVDNGSLQAARIHGSGKPMESGDAVCGFRSNAALTWFKVKTLLNDRVYKATREAQSLARRFGS